MRCPFCGNGADRVVDSREVHEASVIRRRRQCLGCGKRFTSYERIEEIAYMVVKKDGRRERFDRQKLMSGLLKACQKRPVALTTLEGLLDEVENLVQERPEREVAAAEIGALLMSRLRDIDQVAYVRFASVYRRFEDIQEFMAELQGLVKNKQG